jgi:hypothetical protein
LLHFLLHLVFLVVFLHVELELEFAPKLLLLDRGQELLVKLFFFDVIFFPAQLNHVLVEQHEGHRVNDETDEQAELVHSLTILPNHKVLEYDHDGNSERVHVV